MSKKSKSKSNQIYVRLTSDHPEIFQNIQKNAFFINHLMEKHTQSQFYLEVIQNGLLYIYNDMEIFKLLNQPFTPRQVLRFIRKSVSITGLERIFPYYLTKESYPSSGLTIFFHTDSSPRETIVEMGRSQFQSLLKEHALITTTNSGDLSIHFSKFDGFSLYLTLMASMLSGIFQKIPEFQTQEKKNQKNRKSRKNPPSMLH
ncbi:MAG: hypothetical protein ACTSYI_15845 [Promethearchaeota archaeon]